MLAPLFSRLTGIRVIHEVSGEDDVVNKLRTQQETGLPLYDAYVSDSDLIGQHFRDGQVLVLSDYGKGALKNHQALIQLARARGIPVLADPKGKDFSIYRGASLITPNLSEFEAIVGHCQDEAELVAKGARLMNELELGALLVTRG